ncbi:MAG: c-type cytochrome [Undibacterium sp.]|nr:c-type cytochrome [Opitutaceae bacterium]
MSRLSLFHRPLIFATLLAASALALAAADTVPADLELIRFSGPDLTPCVACLCVSAQGEVYAGVDLNGSLGKGPGKGRIVKLLDRDHDGVADAHTVFAAIDNPRGLLAVGTRLYVLHTDHGPDGLATGMNLVVLDDADHDGVADGPAKILVRGICVAKAINDRGTDHSTNGIRMGIDGWIYIAVGDFGFHDATGTDGTKLTLQGGGVARVRPDGTELELYATGTRNDYDVAIDPFMNLFSRGNTNDGGGWNIRFLHLIQSAEYGYPRLFKNFSTEILPALEDLGGGSGVGALFLSEPTWPDRYNNQPLMADWGRKAIYLHRLTPDGPTFTQKVEEFAQISQITDLDVDPSGQMFVGAWDGAGFKGDPGKGYVSRITPKGWTHRAFPDLGTAKLSDLVALIASPSATTRFYAQQEILARPAESTAAKTALAALAHESALALASRVAALFTLAQLEPDPRVMLPFATDNALREFALRAATDRLPRLAAARLPLAPFIAALQTGTPRQRAAAAIALGRLGDPAAASALLAEPFTKPADSADGDFTQKDTLKGQRESNILLTAKPGHELRLHLVSTDHPGQPARLAMTEAGFTLADGGRIPLATLTPESGRATVQPAAPPAPDAATADAAKKKKRAAAGPAVLIEGTSFVAYTVPPGAVSFGARARTPAGSGADVSVEFFASTGPAGQPAEASYAPRHATPNAAIVLPHLAAHALMRLRAVDATLGAVGSKNEDLALWTLSYLHEPAVVDGLLARLTPELSATLRPKILTALARLYQQETPFDGTTWWTTRPDTRGPYYKPVTWSASPRIATALTAESANATPAHREFLARLNDSHRLGLAALGTREVAPVATVAAPSVDLAKISAQKGAVATTALEDLILAVEKLPANPALGEKLFTQQGCVACHALQPGGASLGPYMGQIGSIMNPAQIATAILRPDDTISQGFQTVLLTMKDGSARTGFASETTADKIVLRDMAGAVSTVLTADVKAEKHLPNSMMPAGLANALSLDEFAALVHFLAAKK